MDLVALRYFVQVAELGSITRAAELLHIAQPSLSRHIVLLEHRLGATLLVRRRTGVMPTDAGRLLLDRAKTILRMADAVRDEVMAHGTEPTGSAALGLPTLMLRGMSGRLVARYQREFPEVELHVYDGLTTLLEDLWLSEKLDVAILLEGVQHRIRDAEFTPLVGESLYLAGPPEAGLRFNEPVGLDEVLTDLDAIPLILAGRPGQWRSFCEAACRNAGRRFKPTVLVESADLMIELIGEGLGYCLMSHEAIRGAVDEGRISAAPVRDQTISWTLAVSRKRPFSPAVRELRRLTLEAFEDWVASGGWPVAPLRGSPLRMRPVGRTTVAGGGMTKSGRPAPLLADSAGFGRDEAGEQAR